MKKIIALLFISSLLTLVVIGISSCKKMVNEEPLSDGTLDQFFKSRFDAEAWMSGMYGQFQQTLIGESQFNNRVNFWGDARSDNIEHQAQYSNTSTQEIHFNSLSANNNYADWSGFYKVIASANLAILKFPDINNYAAPGSQDVITDANLKSYLTQCYAMRGICYFWIARIWGDAPIRTEPYLNLADNPILPRLPKDVVLQQAISDLTTAYNMMTKNATPVVWYLGEGAIAASLADIYMWRSPTRPPDYDSAIIWIKNVFRSKAPSGKVYNSSGINTTGSGGSASDLELTAEWKKQFTDPAGSKEAIWNIHWSVNANGCPCMAGVSTANNNTPMRTAREIFTGTWPKDTADVRPKQTFDVKKTDNWDRVWKWYPGTFGPNGPKGDYTGTYGTGLTVYFPMYRLADIFLLYAEALNKKGDMTNALKYLNLIHVRAGLKPYLITDFADETAMETAILRERQWELFAEGKRWFDLVRTDRVIEVMDPILIARQTAQGTTPSGWGTDKRRYYWPLHRNVLNANPGFVQNPPYTD
jgi:starch-binding outer membrane protein, SusD/RagB family